MEEAKIEEKPADAEETKPVEEKADEAEKPAEFNKVDAMASSEDKPAELFKSQDEIKE